MRISEFVGVRASLQSTLPGVRVLQKLHWRMILVGIGAALAMCAYTVCTPAVYCIERMAVTRSEWSIPVGNEYRPALIMMQWVPSRHAFLSWSQIWGVDKEFERAEMVLDMKRAFQRDPQRALFEYEQKSMCQLPPKSARMVFD
ncbi:hypothetical protein [Planctellipticum variicoloris]|uniref:hypothetical protein n=1 Tax=Planctellipticum variicoloris TaxID=3064265 RepID=UPI0030137D25|nr:hypothetical protein SH412_000810 [Planctomycetaceae bacterium SH412]